MNKADWYEPELNPKLRDFAAHYGTVILPSRPYTPTDKGKVEAAVKYVKNNALKGKAFASLANTCAGGVSTSLTSVSTAQPSVRSAPTSRQSKRPP